MIKLLAGRHVIAEDPQVILFDKDGTLIDVHYYWAAMIRFRAEEVVATWFSHFVENRHVFETVVDAMGLDATTGRVSLDGPVGVKPRSEIVRICKETIGTFGVFPSIQEVEEMFRRVDEKSMRNLSSIVRPLPGVGKFLDLALTYGIDLAVVSNDVTERVQKTMALLGWDQYFKILVGGDKVACHKPSPDPAEVVLNWGEYNPCRSVVIGDHPVDMEMGQKAGIPNNIAVLTGLATRVSFEGMNCTVVDDFNYLSLSV